MNQRIPLLAYGLGPIGRQTARMAAERPTLRLIGGVDIDPALTGRDLGELLEVGTLAAPVVADVAALPAVPGAVALHATGSALARVLPQLEALARAGYHIVSTCEELSYPHYHQPELAQRLDAVAQEAGVAIVGTGVNPGFAMDTLPLAITAISRDVSHVRVERRVAAALRREPLQRKVGAGMSPADFEAGVVAGTIRHVGLPESVAAVAGGLGWALDRIEEVIEPVIATEPITTQYLTVQPGQVAGVHQIGRGWQGGSERVMLELTMAVNVAASVDRVWITGDPSLALTLEGIHGDIATAAIVVNAVEAIRHARPGLRTMQEIPLVHR